MHVFFCMLLLPLTLTAGEADQDIEKHLDDFVFFMCGNPKEPDVTKRRPPLPDVLINLIGHYNPYYVLARTLTGHTGLVNSAVFSPDGSHIASASDDKTIRIWNALTGKPYHNIYEDYVVNSVAFNHDGSRIVAALYHTAKIWHVSMTDPVHTLWGHYSPVASAVFDHKNSVIASASFDGTIKIWSAHTGTLLYTLEGHKKAVNSVAFNRNGSQVVSASWDETVKIWDTDSQLCLLTLTGHGKRVLSAVFNHDDSRIASASWDKTVKIWDAHTGKCLLTLAGGDNEVFPSVAFNHDDSLVAASTSKKAKIWDVCTGICLQDLEHDGYIRSVAFSPDGSQMVTASHDWIVRIWRLTSGLLDLVKQAGLHDKVGVDKEAAIQCQHAKRKASHAFSSLVRELCIKPSMGAS